MIRNVVLAATGAVLALTIGAAGAYFTTQMQVPDNVIKAGSVAISSEPTSAALSIDALAPGGTSTRTMSLVNEGSLPVDAVITASKKAGFTELYEALTVRVTVGGTEVYSGALSTMSTTPVRLAPGARGEARFDVSLPATAGNTLAGDYVKLSLYIDGEQAH